MANPNLGQGPQINGIDGEGICLGKIRVALMEGGSPPHLTVSLVVASGGYSLVGGVQASHCSDFSRCRAWGLG